MPTIASEARYADWLLDVESLLHQRGLDVAEAHDFYAFREAYETWQMRSTQAVDDYEVQKRDW